MNRNDIIWLNDILTNSENSSDTELINLFISELNISRATAKQIIKYRDTALISFNFDITEYMGGLIWIT